MNGTQPQAVPVSMRILRLLAGATAVACTVAALVVVADEGSATSETHVGARGTEPGLGAAPRPTGSADFSGPADSTQAQGPETVLRPSQPQAPIPRGESSAGNGDTTDVPPARVGQPAPSASEPFVPQGLTFRHEDDAPLPATLVPVATLPSGELDLPPADQVGWWSGSAEAGQALGTVVLSGHVDSGEGLGYMASLLKAREGDRVILSGGGRTQSFRVTRTRRVLRAKLSEDSRWNDQGGPLKLVLITCYGHYDRERREYLENLIITAEPVPN